MRSRTLPLLLALAATTLTSPLPQQKTGLTAASILEISPSTSSCANSPAAGECRTAHQAGPFINISFTNFGIRDFPTQAALLSLILYESGAFKYSKNHFPGVPGQGTRNMQSPEFNLEYATWLATVCANCGISEVEVRRAEGEGVEAVLGLVNGDEWGLGSAAWFWSTQCDPTVKQGLREGTQEGWEAYLSQCVGTTATEERTAIWRKAMALGSW
ncbi:hypothetical protein LTR37_008411 [Vermiconidia calcicola]|uniref:Uncharacterized protein n=1 Tax=Vermiconidia calcicola TaxID=1690605 RepID=A0ACC3NBL5_9PEZI|nr:hypothetical protein LTR37_008411 [Vermiconidia calcicola]